MRAEKHKKRHERKERLKAFSEKLIFNIIITAIIEIVKKLV